MPFIRYGKLSSILFRPAFNIVQPCQSLFVAPCAHVWHFKCIYPLLIGKRYPHFACPNCRAIWNLEAEVDNPESDGEYEDAGQISSEANQSDSSEPPSAPTEESTARQTLLAGSAPGLADQANDVSMTGNISMDGGNEETTNSPAQISGSGLLARRHASVSAAGQLENSAVRGIALPDATSATAPVDIPGQGQARISSPVSTADVLSGEGPMTPRNNAGPFVFDGSAGRSASRRLHQVAVTEGSEN